MAEKGNIINVTVPVSKNALHTNNATGKSFYSIGIAGVAPDGGWGSVAISSKFVHPVHPYDKATKTFDDTKEVPNVKNIGIVKDWTYSITYKSDELDAAGKAVFKEAKSVSGEELANILKANLEKSKEAGDAAKDAPVEEAEGPEME